MIAARWMLRHPGTSPEPVGIAMAIAAVTGPVILLGIVFNVLLRGDPAPIAATDPAWVAFMDAWATETLHVVLPLYFGMNKIALLAHLRVAAWDGRKPAGGASPAFLGTLLAAFPGQAPGPRRTLTNPA